MPQFDILCFFSQTFWVFIFFNSAYCILISTNLCNLTSIFKVRNILL
ncbi:unnamed protein product [Sphacelaria rigidula]